MLETDVEPAKGTIEGKAEYQICEWFMFNEENC